MFNPLQLLKDSFENLALDVEQKAKSIQEEANDPLDLHMQLYLQSSYVAIETANTQYGQYLDQQKLV